MTANPSFKRTCLWHAAKVKTLGLTMHSGQIYPSLASVLEEWGARPLHVLAARIGAPAEISDLEVDGELVRIETSVTWAEAKHKAVMIEAVAYGPATWLTERVAERLRVGWKPDAGGGDA